MSGERCSWWSGWIIPTGLLVVWYIATNHGLVTPLYLPTPNSVVRVANQQGIDLVYHAAVTFYRVIVGLGAGIVIGYTVGLLMAQYDVVFCYLNNIVEAWRPVPAVALIPFFLLWFGFADIGKILLVVVGVALVMVVEAYEAASEVSPELVRAGYCLGMSREEIAYRVLVPASLPHMRGGVRVALAIGMGLVVVSEFMGASMGIGYLTNLAQTTFNTPLIMLGILIIGVMSWGLDRLIRWGFDLLTRWSSGARDAVE